MQVEINSIWRIRSLDGLDDGNYRLLQHYSAQALLIVFPLSENKVLLRPVKVDFAHFKQAYKGKFIQSTCFELPYYQFNSEENTSAEHLKTRNKRFNLIKDLVNNCDFLLNLVPNPRSKIIAEHAKQQSVITQQVAGI